jgi:CheY-like chemotaxis protein
VAEGDTSDRAVAPPFQGRRILVLEDEALIALMLEDMLLDLGAEIVGPVTTADEALQLLATAAVDAALIDVNVEDGSSVGVADVLARNGCAFAFATGGGSLPPGVHADRPVLSKPYTQRDLERILERPLP